MRTGHRLFCEDFLCIYIYIYMNMYTYICRHIHIYIYSALCPVVIRPCGEVGREGSSSIYTCIYLLFVASSWRGKTGTTCCLLVVFGMRDGALCFCSELSAKFKTISSNRLAASRSYRTPCMPNVALQSCSRNCSPAPDLVLWKLICPHAFFSGGVFISQTPSGQISMLFLFMLFSW